MGKIYVDQTALELQLDTGIDLTTGVDTVYIKYIKPGSNTIAQWVGVVDATKVTKTLSNGELDVLGEWTFWSYVEFTDLTTAPGEPITVVVYTEGN